MNSLKDINLKLKLKKKIIKIDPKYYSDEERSGYRLGHAIVIAASHMSKTGEIDFLIGLIKPIKTQIARMRTLKIKIEQDTKNDDPDGLRESNQSN